MKKAKAPVKVTGLTKVRVLTSGAFGPANTVAALDAATLPIAIKSGEVDPSPAAVAYAESK